MELSFGNTLCMLFVSVFFHEQRIVKFMKFSQAGVRDGQYSGGVSSLAHNYWQRIYRKSLKLPFARHGLSYL